MNDGTDRVMVDIETMGLEPGAAIVSIGAVRFGVNDGLTFDRSITLDSCERAGLTMDAGTLDWWLKQEEAARTQLLGGILLEDALTEFAEWYGDADEIWANSPDFDCRLLEAAYEAVDMEAPWAYYQERDFRTLRHLPVPTDLSRDGVKHDALDDAKYQARIASDVIDHLRGESDD